MSFFSDMVGETYIAKTETNKTRYSKISTREMIGRLNNGLETFSEDDNGKKIIRYNENRIPTHNNDYIVDEDKSFVITIGELFNFKYYVKLGE